MRNNAGFMLMELLIAMAIIALITAVGLPSIRKSLPRYERQTFIARLNALTQLGWQKTIALHKMSRISFNLAQKKVTLAIATDEIDRETKEPKFKPLKSSYLSHSFTIPDSIKIRQLFVEGFDEMKRSTGGKTEETWFYIIPNGLTQQVTINCVDVKDRIQNKPREIGLVLNPFNAQFKIYDTFQAP
jgi:type II secretory pathway pseudopilin PulG